MYSVTEWQTWEGGVPSAYEDVWIPSWCGPAALFLDVDAFLPLPLSLDVAPPPLCFSLCGNKKVLNQSSVNLFLAGNA